MHENFILLEHIKTVIRWRGKERRSARRRNEEIQYTKKNNCGDSKKKEISNIEIIQKQKYC